LILSCALGVMLQRVKIKIREAPSPI